MVSERTEYSSGGPWPSLPRLAETPLLVIAARQSRPVHALQVGYPDVAIMAKCLQVIVVVPAPEPVTAAIPGHDMIDFNAAPWRAHAAMLALPPVAASHQFSCGSPMVLVAVPAATSITAPTPPSLGKRIAASPAMSLSRYDQRAIWLHAGSGFHDMVRASSPHPVKLPVR